MQTVINISSNLVLCIECNWENILINPWQKKDLSTECFSVLQNSTYIENTHRATTTPDTSKTLIQLCIDQWLESVANGAPTAWMSDFQNAVRKVQDYVDFKPTPVWYTPTPTGNTTDLNDFIIDPIWDIYFIDYQWDSRKLNTTIPNYSVLWDAAGSVATPITVNTPIEINPDVTVRKVLTNGTKVLVPADRLPVRRTLTPTSIVTANPLVPNNVNLGGKDYYSTFINYTDTVPWAANEKYFYTFNTRQVIFTSSLNTAGDVETWITWTWIIFDWANTDWFSSNQAKHIFTMWAEWKNTVALAWWTVINFTQYIYIRIDTWAQLTNIWWTIIADYNNNIIEYLPA